MEKPLRGQRKNCGTARKRLFLPSARMRFALGAAAFVLFPPLSAAAAGALRLSAALAPDSALRALGMPAHWTGFAAGTLLFCLAYSVVRIPPRVYIIAHEATHALFALLCGVRPRDLRVEDETGSIEIARPNAVILLSPYFFPLPAAVALAAFGLLSLFLPVVGTAAGAALSAVPGAAWGFHFCFTLNALLQHQTDLDAYGFLFSFLLTVFLNLAFLIVADVALGPVSAGGALSLFLASGRQSFCAVVDLAMRWA